MLRLLSSTGLATVRGICEGIPKRRRGVHTRRFLAEFERYHATIDGVIAFLQGRDSTLAHRIASSQFLPEGSRFESLENYLAEFEGGDPLAWAFGAPWSYVAFIALAGLFVIWKHRENIIRLSRGDENRISLGQRKGAARDG